MPLRNGPFGDQESRESRMALILRVEWSLLAFRYMGCILVGAYCLWEGDAGLIKMFALVGGVALLHNIFVHWVMYRKKHFLFVSPVNFCLYLSYCCFLIGITGGAASYFAPLLMFVIIGYHIYKPRAGNTLWITLLVCAAYSFTVVAGWMVTGLSWLHLPVYVNLVYIVTCGWVMSVLSQLLHVLEKDSRRHAAALGSSEATLRAILNHTAHPIVVYDDSELITEANDSACNFLGVPRQNLIGMRFQAYMFDDGSLPESLAELKRSGSLYQEMLVLPAGGGERHVFMHVHSFLGESKRFFVALFHDITEQKELQETHRLAKISLEEANRELQRAAELRAAFYTDVANRLRSPLAAMLGYMDMFLEEQLGEVTPEQRKALHSCRRSLLRIFEQIDEAFLPEPQETKAEAEIDTLETEDFGAGI